jgi:hypothetical protein
LLVSYFFHLFFFHLIELLLLLFFVCLEIFLLSPEFLHLGIECHFLGIQLLLLLLIKLDGLVQLLLFFIKDSLHTVWKCGGWLLRRGLVA